MAEDMMVKEREIGETRGREMTVDGGCLWDGDSSRQTAGQVMYRAYNSECDGHGEGWCNPRQLKFK